MLQINDNVHNITSTNFSLLYLNETGEILKFSSRPVNCAGVSPALSLNFSLLAFMRDANDTAPSLNNDSITTKSYDGVDNTTYFTACITVAEKFNDSSMIVTTGNN